MTHPLATARADFYLPKDFRPMLSGKPEARKKHGLDILQFPLWGSPKIDGFRIHLSDKGSLTRSNKRIPNRFTAACFDKLTKEFPGFRGLDGELTHGDPAGINELENFQLTGSVFLSYEGEPQFTYWVFDDFFDPQRPYFQRYQDLEAYWALYQDAWQRCMPANRHLVRVPQRLLHSLEEMHAFYEECMRDGYEGIMLRNASRPYKFNRSSITQTQQHLVKIKAFDDAEGEIVGFEELMHNENEAKEDNFGLTKRSSHKENKRPGNTLGKFIVRILNGRFEGKVVKVGTGQGLTQALRQEIWNNQEKYIHAQITFRYQDIGSKDLPRCPVFHGFRPAGM